MLPARCLLVAAALAAMLPAFCAGQDAGRSLLSEEPSSSPDLYDLTAWALHHAARSNEIAASLSALMGNTSRSEFFAVLPKYQMAAANAASGAQITSLLSGKGALGITLLLPNTLGYTKGVRRAMLPFLALVGPPPGPNANFSQLADLSNSRQSYAPPRNSFFPATFGLRGTWLLAPVGEPFKSRRGCRGHKLPLEPGVRANSCSKMLRRLRFLEVEYDLPQGKGQYDALLALRAKYQEQPTAAETEGCTNYVPDCKYVEDAKYVAPNVELLGRFISLDGIYGESSMLTTTPNPYSLPSSGQAAGGAGSVKLLSFSNPGCPGYSLYQCVYVPPGVTLDAVSEGVGEVASSTTSESYYTEVGVSAEVSAGYGAFSGEVGASYEATSLQSSSYYSVKVYAYQKLYALQLDQSQTAQFLTEGFKADVAALNSGQMSNKTFATKYGCYYLSGLFVGGKYRMSTSYSIYTTEDTEAAELQVSAEHKAYAASAEAGAATSTSTYDSDATLFWRSVGGDATQVSNYDDWAATVWSSTWVMMDTTNAPLSKSYLGTTKITAANGPMVQAGASVDALAAVDGACVWGDGAVQTTALELVNPACSYTYDTKSNPMGYEGCGFSEEDVTISPSYLRDGEVRPNFVTGLCATVNNDQKMNLWGTWLTAIDTGDKIFGAGTAGATTFACDPYRDCAACKELYDIQQCVQVPQNTAIVGVCITVNGDSTRVTGMQLWWAKLQPYEDENNSGNYRAAFQPENYAVYKDADGYSYPCDLSDPSASAIIKLDDTANPKWKNTVITGIATRYQDASRDYLAVYTSELKLTATSL
ncbi:hypothetical protein Rsub_12368 [Raphidocelis subcapitata]|uniref:Uncharacterized protein n=1 Tax=Raphidocelis subcapitata TaxID=307507 RepID=A0A2V0PIN5_9CHLO|nr:hypothetical protein Rsub_12368 [Raphidocelis subcapitata]|eukprot:GBF99674.1 hypothetical protein Rsub_12368 [Raphidocelis subcapitata]